MSPRVLSSLSVLALLVTCGVGCAAPSDDEDSAGDSGEAVTESSDIGDGWTRQVLGASKTNTALCKAASGDEPCATRFRGRIIAGAQNGVNIVRGNGTKYFLHVQSESPWLHFTDTLEDEAAAPGADAEMLYGGSSFSVTDVDHYFTSHGERCAHLGVVVDLDNNNRGYPLREGFSTDLCQHDLGKRVRYVHRDADTLVFVTIDWAARPR